MDLIVVFFLWKEGTARLQMNGLVMFIFFSSFIWGIPGRTNLFLRSNPTQSTDHSTSLRD